MIDLDIQILILLYSFMSGILFGIGFDIYRMLFRVLNNKILGVIRDVIYFVIVGLTVFCFLLYTQYAILSVYTYFYIFLGVMVYLKVISRFVFPIVQKILEFLVWIMMYVFRNFVYIFRRSMTKKNSNNILKKN